MILDNQDNNDIINYTNINNTNINDTNNYNCINNDNNKKLINNINYLLRKIDNDFDNFIIEFCLPIICLITFILFFTTYDKFYLPIYFIISIINLIIIIQYKLFTKICLNIYHSNYINENILFNQVISIKFIISSLMILFTCKLTSEIYIINNNPPLLVQNTSFNNFKQFTYNFGISIYLYSTFVIIYCLTSKLFFVTNGYNDKFCINYKYKLDYSNYNIDKLNIISIFDIFTKFIFPYIFHSINNLIVNIILYKLSTTILNSCYLILYIIHLIFAFYHPIYSVYIKFFHQYNIIINIIFIIFNYDKTFDIIFRIIISTHLIIVMPWVQKIENNIVIEQNDI